MNAFNRKDFDNWLRNISDSSERVIRVFCMMRGQTSLALMKCALDLAISSDGLWNPLDESEMDYILDFYKKYDMERDADKIAA